jgi:hypothetical protein
MKPFLCFFLISASVSCQTASDFIENALYWFKETKD